MPRAWRDSLVAALVIALTCDAPLFMDTDVAVLGGGNSAFTAAYELTRIARKVYLINRSPWKADEVYLEKIREQQTRPTCWV